MKEKGVQIGSETYLAEERRRLAARKAAEREKRLANRYDRLKGFMDDLKKKPNLTA
jgi:hypothetical protein